MRARKLDAARRPVFFASAQTFVRLLNPVRLGQMNQAKVGDVGKNRGLKRMSPPSAVVLIRHNVAAQARQGGHEARRPDLRSAP